jgi:hypothetical protein
VPTVEPEGLSGPEISDLRADARLLRGSSITPPTVSGPSSTPAASSSRTSRMALALAHVLTRNPVLHTSPGPSGNSRSTR